MNTIFKATIPIKPFNAHTCYLHLRMYGFEPLEKIRSDVLRAAATLSYYAKRGDVTYSITITPQIMTIGYTPIEENVVSAIAGLCNAIVEIDEREESA